MPTVTVHDKRFRALMKVASTRPSDAGETISLAEAQQALKVLDVAPADHAHAVVQSFWRS